MHTNRPSFRRWLISRFAGYLALALLLLAAASVAAYVGLSRAALAELAAAEQRHTLVAAAEIAHDLQAVVADLMVTADSTALWAVLNDNSPATRRRLGEELRTMLRHKPTYDQVRYLDAAGMEVVRVQRAGGDVRSIDERELQTKSDRYYFTETNTLPKGRIFVSPFDLNVEDGVIEQPYKPTIRFALPLFDDQGDRRGILVINYLGAHLFDSLQSAARDMRGRVMLVNAQGYWLFAGDARKEWGFMFPDRQDQRFSVAFPLAWDVVQRETDGQFRESGGLFTFATVLPLEAAVANFPGKVMVTSLAGPEDYRWKVIAHVAPDTLTAVSRSWRTTLLRLVTVIVGLVVLGSWVAARHGAAHAVAAYDLTENEARFREMAETIGQVFWTTTHDRGEFTYVSPAFAVLWGRPVPAPSEIRAIWLAAVHPEDQPRVAPYFGPAEVREAFDIQYRVCQQDGSVTWIRDQGFPVRDAEQRVLRFVGIAEDITRLKDAQLRLLQSERLVAIGETMTGLAHESRNALQRSQACLEMLTKRIVDRPEAVELAGKIQAAQNDLHHLYERVREYAAPLRVRRRAIDLRDLLDQCVRELEAPIRQRQAIITHSGREGQIWCDGDAFQLRQVFRNILENALDPELDQRVERTRVEIAISWKDTSRAGEDAVQITFTDNGPGADLDDWEQMFEPFITTRTQGTGLGMAIARRIVQAHDGQIVAFPAEHGGMAVQMTLPRRIRDAAA